MTENMKTDGYNMDAGNDEPVSQRTNWPSEKSKSPNLKNAPTIGGAMESKAALKTKEEEEKASYDRLLVLAKGNYAQIEKLDEATFSLSS